MMAEEEMVKAPIASGVECVISESQDHVGFKFLTSDGPVIVAMPVTNIGEMIALLIKLAQKIASKVVPEIKQGEDMIVHPIDLTALAITPGRTEAEALLHARLGPLTLTFSVQLSMLLDQLERLRRQTVPNPDDGRKLQ